MTCDTSRDIRRHKASNYDTVYDLAAEHLDDLRRIDTRRREARKKINAAVRAS